MQSAWPTYMVPAVSKAMDEGSQLVVPSKGEPRSKGPRRFPLASNRAIVPFEGPPPGVLGYQWGT